MSAISRREFIGMGAAAALMARGSGERGLPNIVLILADDLGIGDVHCLNARRGRLPTPHIDRLAAEGITFTDAHSGSAVCSPTRYGILTGRYAWRSRLQRGVLGPYEAPLIPPDRLTLPAMLRARGYATACIGKWHLGWNWPRENGQVIFDRPIAGGPTAVGFDSYFGTDVPNYPPYCFLENDRTVGTPSVPKPKSMYGLDGAMLPGWRLDAILPELTRRAGTFIRESAARRAPVFLYLALTAPHTPLAVAEEWKGRSGLGLYGDWVMQTDWSVGETLKALDESGARDRTLVFFTSDNGCAPYIGVDYDRERDKMGRVKELEAKGHFPSAGCRGYKSDIWEGGHHIPLMARWPGVVRPDTRTDQVVCLTDILATCAEITGAAMPPDGGEDSVSVLAALRGLARRPLREAVVHHSISGRFAIRQGPWKLALCPGSGGWSEPTDAHAAAQGLPPVQLYNLADDPGEQRNLQKEHPGEVRRLARILDRYVALGRSTPGPERANDVAVHVRKANQEGKIGSD